MAMLTTKKLIPVDITLDGVYRGKDPFLSEITGEFAGPGGKTLIIPGFYRGNGKWSVRFSAEEEGKWNYHISSGEVALGGDTAGSIKVEGEEPGATRILRTSGTRFVTSDGKSVFLLGYECNFLFSLLASPDGFAKLQKFVSNIKEAGFNQVQINTYAVDTEWHKGKTCENDFGPAYIDLWEKTEDGRRFNPAFFENFDWLISYLHVNGIYAHIYLRVYNKFVEWPENYSEEDYAFYRLFTARYQAFPNVIWNISKEGYFEPDKEYFHTMLGRVRAWDAYKHLCTVHDDLQYALDEKYSDTIDFLTLQQHYDWQHAHLYYIEKSGKPVFGGETGVESPHTDRFRRYPAERVCAIAYEIIMAGAYYQYYYTDSAWDIIEYDYKPKGYEYIKRMTAFFSRFDLNRFKAVPHLCVWSGLCLDDGESTMLVYTEPKEHIPNYINKEGCTLINPNNGRKFISCEAFGVYSGKTENYIPSHGFQARTDNSLFKDIDIYFSYPDEPTVFVIRYEK